METILNTKQYVLMKDGNNYIYQYKEIDINDGALIELHNMMKTTFKSAHLLKPKKLETNNLLTATYKLSKEDTYLFDSLYEFEENYITGGAETVLSFSHKAILIKQLCEAVEELNKKDIHIQKIDEKSLLYNYNLNHLSIDLVNVLSKEKNQNQLGFTHTKMYQNVKSEKKKSIFSSLKKGKQIEENKNNLFLGFLIHKILFNREWFNNIPLKDVQIKLKENKALSDIFSLHTEGELIPPSFYRDFSRILLGKQAEGDLTRTPSDYQMIIDNLACPCKDGYFRFEENSNHCDACGGNHLGDIHLEETDSSIPLIFSYQYNLSESFDIKKDTILMRTASKEDVYAIFFPSEYDIQIKDEKGEKIEPLMNSKKDHYRLDFIPNKAFERTIIINENYTFTVRSLISTGGTDETE